MGFRDKVKEKFHIGSQKNDKKNNGQQQQQKKNAPTATEKEAISKMRAMANDAKLPDITKSKYEKLMEQKVLLESQAGDSEDAKNAKAELESGLEIAGEIVRKKDKQDKYVEVIQKQKNKPLETLINKNSKMTDTIGPDEGKYDAVNGKVSVGSVAKEQVKSAPRNIKEAVKEYFLGLKSNMDGLFDKLAGVVDGGGGGLDLGSTVGDLTDVDDVVKDIKAKGGDGPDGVGIAGAAIGGVSSVLKLIKVGISLGKEFKKHHDANGAVHRDAQERWKLSRMYIREGVDIIEGFVNIGGAWGSGIPYFGSITGLCFGGISMLMDVVDMITTSVHIDYMRKDRDKIFKRIQAKRDKYSAKDDSGRTIDAEAAEAYDIGHIGFFSTEDKAVDKKRRALMKTLGEKEVKANKMTKATKLRSRNDSEYRDMQYGLGKRINTQGISKSEKRQLKALEMMEQYRELDKSHKKMRKALYHHIEDILKGGVGIVGNGLKLAGEIAVLSGVGAVGGAGLIAAGTATGLGLGVYDVSRDAVAKGYHGIRTLTGTRDNKATTREDMAISIIDRMTEISDSPNVWDSSSGKFKSEAALKSVAGAGRKDVIRQARNVEHLHSVLRRGLDVTMSDLIASKNRNQLKEQIADAFGQD